MISLTTEMLRGNVPVPLTLRRLLLLMVLNDTIVMNVFAMQWSTSI